MGILTRATRNLARRKTRALIVIIALSLALTLLIILPPSIDARQVLTQKVINSIIFSDGWINSTVTLSATEIQCDYPPPYLSSTISISDVNLPQPLMNESLYDKISSIPDVTSIVPTLDVLSTANRSYDIYGVPLDNVSLTEDPSILPSNITAGRNLRVGDSGVVILDEETAKNFSVSIGGTVSISGRNLTVVGIEGF
jgi:hypothetical protein